MGLIVKHDEKDVEFELIPAGTYQAVIFNYYDIGMVEEQFKGKPKTTHKIVIGYEFPKLVYQTGKFKGSIMTKYQDYSFSLYQSRLLTLIETCIGRKLTDEEVNTTGYDLDGLIGKNLTLTIQHQKSQKNDKTYANITTIGGLIEGLKIIEPSIAKEYTPDHLKEKIVKTDEPEVDLKQIVLMAEKQLSQFISEGLLSTGDISSSITAITGIKQPFRSLNKENIDKVMTKMIALAEFKKQDLTSGTDFDDTPVTF